MKMTLENIKKMISARHVATYSVILVATAIFLWVINYFNIAYPLTITTKPSSGDLSVVGVGKIDIVPDTANVSLGIVVNNAPTVQEAQSKMNTINNAIIEGVKKLDIKKDDIKTSNYSINPNYSYDGGRNEVTGYNGSATVTIKVRETSKLGDVIQAATDAGANQVNGTNYSIDKPEDYREQARNAAIANAKEQAQKLANQLGIRLGKVTNIVESSGGSEPPVMLERAMSVDSSGIGGAPSPNLEPGSQTITSTVTLYFEKR